MSSFNLTIPGHIVDLGGKVAATMHYDFKNLTKATKSKFISCLTTGIAKGGGLATEKALEIRALYNLPSINFMTNGEVHWNTNTPEVKAALLAMLTMDRMTYGNRYVLYEKNAKDEEERSKKARWVGNYHRNLWASVQAIAAQQIPETGRIQFARAITMEYRKNHKLDLGTCDQVNEIAIALKKDKSVVVPCDIRINGSGGEITERLKDYLIVD